MKIIERAKIIVAWLSMHNSDPFSSHGHCPVCVCHAVFGGVWQAGRRWTEPEQVTEAEGRRGTDKQANEERVTVETEQQRV